MQNIPCTLENILPIYYDLCQLHRKCEFAYVCNTGYCKYDTGYCKYDSNMIGSADDEKSSLRND